MKRKKNISNQIFLPVIVITISAIVLIILVSNILIKELTKTISTYR
ncbi:MAG: hypothetical protein RBT74_14800 [Tenuifilaceae bacterium]|nr:hypothetical protein [Tenuifilaceae bacterium]